MSTLQTKKQCLTKELDKKMMMFSYNGRRNICGRFLFHVADFQPRIVVSRKMSCIDDLFIPKDGEKIP